MFDLHQKIAVVTGGGSGIGAAIAALFARQGARTVVLDLNETAAATADAIRAAGGDAIARRVGTRGLCAACPREARSPGADAARRR